MSQLRQARTITTAQFHQALNTAVNLRHPHRNKATLLLSFKAGLRAGEIAQLDWRMLLDANGKLGTTLNLPGIITKSGRARRIPIHPDLRKALLKLYRITGPLGPVILSERGKAMSAKSVVNWFKNIYDNTGLEGCSSHSGRRTFVTNAARLIHKAGGSLRDVQLLAGHQSIITTQRYIDGDSDAQRKLVSLI
ncbi:tyrosine-type recombinase/integrase [Pseudochrobactrum asaccharolyticum]|uniref:Integrase/recombinase XerD n=1 Tax=Pseudochrobactrum asaccharolyticum TaxID=354351 RepID=A0A366E4J1_9HYPH|nr:site-specific integrase [Pseudochrobactrum asaccharolyticum]MBX8802008.1 site-specific integrase [Ochrobactrum sp. MR28]MBX8817708.1 site-specific integrase [Ochrobactrum sp. MR31]RBO97232.1 integrase/recombinase XerD [Pseudochrobactrum asaccharolyticum]